MESSRHLIDQFRASRPYTLLPEPTSTPGRVAYRLRITRPVPVAVSTTVGDVLHNMRGPGKPGVRTGPAQPCDTPETRPGESVHVPDL